ncbi:hypothetical protein ACH5RR_007855 [Cinchona calisaya]|uniref:Nuclease associated modular domain-containing protein n=1 Tax=Cinchona calisaya TaxID=153742 RepID=A0ABD3ABJ8_9GENT
MPLLDIAIAQSWLGNNLYTFRSQTVLHNKFVYRNEKGLLAFPWKSLCIPEKASTFNLGRIHKWRGRLVIKAVATLEATRLTQRNDEFSLRVDVDSGISGVSDGDEEQSSGEDLAEPNDREKLRRMRISKANKGNTPWNKGRKHSPETLKRIRERTRLAMQDPKVRMKLMTLGHAQSEATRMKIGVGVRIGWEKRREKLILQETCLYEWQNLIAETSRRGVLDEEELQWNSYKILNEKLEQEWVQSVEERKSISRPKGSKRAPKSLEQRRKISESISAKWTDPTYRNRVFSGLAKYHGITKCVERKPSGDGQTRKTSPSNRKIVSDDSVKPEPRSQIQRVGLKSTVAPYKDPLVSAKLEMLKNIRAQRAAAESKKTEAIARAKLLIAEAEKAAKSLEVAAKKSPVARASLVETRKLIAEAIRCISSIDGGQEDSQNDGSISPDLSSLTELEMSANSEDPNQIVERKVNGAQTSASSNGDLLRFNFEKPELQDLDMMGFNIEVPALRDLVNGTEVQLSSLSCHDPVNGKENFYQTRLKDHNVAPVSLESTIKLSGCTEHIGDTESNGSIDRANSPLLNGVKSQSSTKETYPKSATLTKKWVRGRLVGVTEES